MTAPVLERRSGKGPAVGWSVAYLVLAFLLAGVLAFLIGLAVTGSPQGVIDWTRRLGAEILVLQGATGVVAALALTWLIGVRICRFTWADLRYHQPRPTQGFGIGLLLGLVAAGGAVLLAVLVGGAQWVGDEGGVADYLMQLGRTLLVLAPPALAEEMLFRGLPLVLLATAFGRWPALVALAAVFGLAHANNPNATALGAVNIMAAGLFLGLAFFAPGGIWTAFGAHLGWNGMLAALDAPVSGLPFRIPFIDYEPGGPVWLTGGAFGPEGGLTATLAIALAAAFTARQLRKDPAA